MEIPWEEIPPPINSQLPRWATASTNPRPLAKASSSTSGPPVTDPPPTRPETPLEAARSAFEGRRFPEALGIVNESLRTAKPGPERSLYLGMKGSIFYSLDDLDGARDAWENAVKEDPSNREVREIMKFLKSQQEEEGRQ